MQMHILGSISKLHSMSNEFFVITWIAWHFNSIHLQTTCLESGDIHVQENKPVKTVVPD